MTFAPLLIARLESGLSEVISVSPFLAFLKIPLLASSGPALLSKFQLSDLNLVLFQPWKQHKPQYDVCLQL